MKKIEGYCDGGPLAGKQLAHYESRYRMAFVPQSQMPKVTDHPFDGDTIAVEVSYGEYVFDEGAWRWRGPDFLSDAG